MRLDDEPDFLRALIDVQNIRLWLEFRKEDRCQSTVPNTDGSRNVSVEKKTVNSANEENNGNSST